MCLKDASMSANIVHEVILAGGSAWNPLLQSYVHQYFKYKELNVREQLQTTPACGAAIQSFFCDNREACSLSLLDVTPFSLGIQYPRGKMAVCIPKNTLFPTKKKKPLHANNRNTKLFFEVYEGELIIENNLLGKFELSEVPTMCNFNITFDIHENGTLTVMAEEISTRIRNGITIIDKNIEHSRIRVQETFQYKESPKGINKASTSKNLTRSSTSSTWAQRGILDKIRTMNKEPKEYAIGIDFGTTYSSVAVWQRNCVKIIENEYGSRLTCSAVAFTDTGRLIGDTVHKEQVTTNPENTIPNIKRLIGNCYDQSIPNGSKFLPFKILQPEGKNRSMISVEYMNEKKLFAPEEIAAMILSKMKEIAEAHLSKVVTKAVISVPACFSDSQRQAIKDAGVIAGLNVLQLLNEPTAAAIAYFRQKISGGSSGEKTLLIFDLGGGNLDVSILTINDGVIRVRVVSGDANLGGEDFDKNMVNYFIKKFKEEKKKDINNKPRSLRRLRAACEKAKRVLSTNAQTVVEIDALDEGIDFRSVITRETFEELNKSLFKRSISCVERCLEDAKMNRSCIDEVVLVGGSTRIPKMQQVLREFFEGKELCKSMNADEAVVYGAAVQAAILSGNENYEKFNISELRDVTSRSFGLKTKNGAIIVIPKHTPIKEEKKQHFIPDNPSSFSMEIQECGIASSTVFNISGITPKPKVNSNIIITFEVDESGILNLMAKDVSENNEKIVISKENDSLSGEEIEKMKEAADCYKKHDEENKARAAVLNSLEIVAYKMKTIARGPSVSALDKKSLEEEADKVLTWIETNQNAEIDKINDFKKHYETIIT
ncbi:heat shock 70 kDa protein 18-like [Carex rostrata]